MNGKGIDKQRFREQLKPGVHAVSYYYSEEHLLVKSAQWVLSGVQSGEKCLINLDPTLHEQFDHVLARLGVDVVEAKHQGQLQLFSFLELYDLYRTEGLDKLVPAVEEMLQKAWEEGFSGIRILGEANYGIWGVDPEHCFQWEADFDKITLTYPLKALCLYDLQDLLQMIQEDTTFLQSTMSSHRYFYKGGQTVSNHLFGQQVLKGAN